MKFFSQKNSSTSLKVLVASSYANVALNASDITLAKDINSQILSPFNIITDACLETSKGIITGCDTILRLLARMRPEVSLYGDSLIEQAEVDGWLSFASNLESSFLTNDSSTYENLLKQLDTFLLNYTYLVGQNVTLADISVSVTLFIKKLSSQLGLSEFKNIERWMNTITQQKQFLKVSSKEETKTQQSQKKDSEKKVSSQETKENQEEDVGVLQLSIMDKWKKFYSNSKNKLEEVMPWFWNEKELHQNYSIWFMKYNKLPTEGKLDFITCNMLNGFIQRIDNSIRGESFGLIHVVGVKGDYDVQGVWLFSGEQIPKPLQEHPSFEYNTFTKLDPTSEENQKIVNEYWCHTEDVQGRPVIDIQVWK